ncbi:MAG: hypothetical protein JXA10_14145 [Anaerolineae bacterium]|nr:hypothetical protein [Anaerolineae bacterium]
MVKKIILSVLFVGLVVVLLIGAVHRTNSQTGSSNDHSEGGNADQVREQNGQSGENGNGAGANANAADALVWGTFAGTAVDATESELLLQSGTGEQLLIEGKAWTYAQEQGFSVTSAESITVTGFYEGDEFVAASLTRTAAGQTIWLRDATTGRPLWAGRGRGGRN